MKIKAALLLLFSLFSFSSHAISLYFDTEDAPKLFTFGARVGLNVSNRTFEKPAFEKWNVNSWGFGFEAGGVVNINFKEYLALQPGFFFESRSGNYSYAMDYRTNANKVDTFYQLGHVRNYNFTVPVMGILRFNLNDDIKWLLELGPYFQLNLHSSDGKQIQVPVWSPNTNNYSLTLAKTNSCDLGIKIGTGLMLFNHYYAAIHYMAGLTDAWKYPAGGSNKAWTFTLGYDF